MSFWAATIMMTFDDALKTLSLRDAFHIDPVSLLEYVGLHDLTDLGVTDLYKFPQGTVRRETLFLQMTALGPVELPILDFIKRELDGFITVMIFTSDQ